MESIEEKPRVRSYSLGSAHPPVTVGDHLGPLHGPHLHGQAGSRLLAEGPAPSERSSQGRPSLTHWRAVLTPAAPHPGPANPPKPEPTVFQLLSEQSSVLSAALPLAHFSPEPPFKSSFCQDKIRRYIRTVKSSGQFSVLCDAAQSTRHHL